MKSSTKIFMGILIVVILGFSVARLTGNASAELGKYDSFAQCLTDSGVKMYGAYWCPHCKDQKKAFGNSFKKVNYVECDARGDNANPQACESAGIKGYPTWIFTDGTRASGNQPLSQLSQRSGCALP